MLKERFEQLYRLRRVLGDMALKQFKARYAGSYLGIWWALATPVLLALSIDFVFTAVFKLSQPHYALFVLSGLLPWFFFSGALEEAANAFVHHAPIVRQGIFPREFIPLAVILAHMYNFLVGLIFLLPVFIFFNPKAALYLPLLLVLIPLQLIFISGMGLLLSCLNIFFRDLGHVLSTVFMAWFWLTPVFYSLEPLPESMRLACLCNPMSHFVMAYQNALFWARPVSWEVIFLTGGLSLLSWAAGHAVFIKNEAELLKRI